MKPYVVFYGDNYYPIGGWEDNKEFSYSLESAKGFADGVTKEWGKWAHVVDLVDQVIVYKTEHRED